MACPVQDRSTSVDGDEHTGRPTSCTTPETVARLQELIYQDRHRTIRDIAEEVEFGYGTCQRVLTELGIHRVAAKFVPRILTVDQKQQSVSVCTELRQLASDDENFLSRVITGERAGFTVTTLRQRDNPPSGKAPRHQGQKGQTGEKQSQEHYHHFLDIKGIVHKEFVPRGQIVNSGFYCEVLRRLRERVRRLRPQLWREQTWLLHHDNAPSHTAVITDKFLAKNKIAVIPHPPYSPDLSPCDIFLFLKI